MNYKKLKTNSILWIVLIGVFFYWALNNLELIWHAFLYLTNLLMPVLVGIALTFILGVFTDLLETKIFRADQSSQKHKRISRILSVVFSILIFFGILALILVILIPKTLSSVQALSDTLPDQLAQLTRVINDFANKHPMLKTFLEQANFNVNSIQDKIEGILTGILPNAMRGILGFTSSLISTTMNIFIGLIFAAYFLLQRETILKNMLRVSYAYTSDKTTKKISHIIALSADAFHNFVMGQMLESIICGTLAYLVLMIFGIKEAVLLGFITGVGALIPLFGATVAAILSFLLLLIISPSQALLGLILIVVVVQVDGNFIYPHVAGNRLGIPPLILLIAVTFFGSLFGLTGMVVGVPFMTIVYTLIQESITKRITEKSELEMLLAGEKKNIRAPRREKLPIPRQ